MEENKKIKTIFGISKKNVKNLIPLVTILILILCIFIGAVKNIDYKYTGLKYQAGNLKYEEPVNVEIKGKYIKGLFNSFDRFYGEIIVDGKAFDYSDFVQEVYNYKKIPLALKPENEGLYGDLFYNSIFQQITIPVREQKGNNQYGWSSTDGYLICAPCKSREQAVDISNKLIPKQYMISYPVK